MSVSILYTIKPHRNDIALQVLYPPISIRKTNSRPIKFGILGAARIAPSALINPTKSHAEVIVYAISSRDWDKATAFAKKYNIGKVYGGPNGYQGFSLAEYWNA